MKKISKSILGLAGVVSAAWWLGGMMYFILVAKHYRDKENREDVNKNLATWVTNPTSPSIDKQTPSVKPPRPIRDPDPLQNIRVQPDKWRSYYKPTTRWDTRGLRPGETGWDD